ncbi:MAG: polysaccharide biosynthesis tyrosine autokinase [Candidatus Sumerlaeia bacterium]|nr:polysaccharide biosynthesis tyrosine autokinase [Candidatus Sumerlaeia bacterium]
MSLSERDYQTPRPAAPGLPPLPDENEENELLRYMRLAWERRWLVLLCTAAFLLFTAVQLRKTTNIFIATARIKFEPSATRYLDFGEVGRPTNAIDEIRTQVEIIRGPQITHDVIRSLGLDRPRQAAAATQDSTRNPLDIVDTLTRQWNHLKREARAFLVPSPPVEIPADLQRQQWMIAWLRDRVQVRQYQDTKLIDIIVRDSDPRRAADIANAYAEQYQRSLGARRTDSYDSVRKFFDEQLQQARLDLIRANEAVLDYSARLDTDLQLMEQESEIALDMTRSLRREVETLRNEIALIDAQESIEDDGAIKAHLLSRDRLYIDLTNRISELELRRIALVAENTEDHPEVVRIDRQIGSLRENLDSHVALFDLQTTGESLLSRERLRALQERLREQEQRFNRLSEQLIGYRPLRMNVEVQQQLYDQLLARAKEIGVASEVIPDNVTIQAPAAIPTVASEPRVFSALIGNGLLGFLLGCVLAIGLGLADRTIHDPHRVTLMTGLPSLAIIPFLGRGRFNLLRLRRRDPVQLTHKLDPYSTQAESFRLLRTAMLYSTAGQSPRAIVVTSCTPSEGKSTVAANLALAFAGLGEKTLLIDADLKLPNVHRIFQTRKTPGLTDVLTNQVQVESAIVESGIGNLAILPAGPTAPNPVELLDSAEMSALLDTLKQRYQRIILDSAPLHGMSDGFVLAGKADGVCLVASLGRTRIDILRRIVGQMQSLKNRRILGIVFNDQSGRGLPGRKGDYGLEGNGAYGYTRSGRGRYDKRRRHESDEVKMLAKKG